MSRQGGTFSALRIRFFPRLWASGLTWGLSRWGVSFVGPFIANDLTGSARMVQLTGVAMWAPMLFGGVVGGWVSDRFDRRRVVAGQFFVTIPALSALAWAAFADQLDVWMVYPVSFVVGVGWVVDMTSRRAIVYDIVGTDDVGNAMALESTGTSLALAAGALAGGTLIEAAGVGWALLVMAALQAVSLATFLTVPRIVRSAPSGADDGSIRDGLRMLRTEVGLVSILGVTALVNFFFFATTPLVQVVGGKFEVGPTLLGLLAAMLGFGMFVGSLLVAYYSPAAAAGAYVLGSYTAMVFMLLFAVAPVYGLAAAALLAASAGMGGFAATQAALVMETVPEDRRGRALGLLSSAIDVLPVGMFVIGEVAEVVAPSTAVALSIITGTALLSVFLRFRPESWHVTTGGEQRRQRRVPRGASPTVFGVVRGGS